MAQELLLIDVPVGTQTTITTTNADAALDRRLHELVATRVRAGRASTVRSTVGTTTSSIFLVPIRWTRSAPMRH
ncbi:hypothetical protein [Corynebacterium sp. HMSC29G08]|uniref:hypothetical protein n=1 Tax=Corynebacterium sp. HMSC29G08 TaxID=1581069 RepID=UPI0008A121E8|nr:hypothetical protein [Corynebacterium sp. HMSC29G08]OFT81333.1 hypothetical protein HMPREF3101_10250 [Corynebacterium sp. HMSC29G08]